MIYFLILLPSTILLLFVFGWPLIRYSWLSLNANSVLTGLISIPNNGANWTRLFYDERFWIDVLQTGRFAVISVSLEVLIAFFIALLLDQTWRGRSVVRAITLLPWALPTTMMALGWRWIFNTPYGPIEKFFVALNIEQINWLGNPNFAWLSTVVADVWKTTPFITLILLAGLQSIPKDLYEAFRLEGGKSISALKEITIPMLTPYILLSLLFRTAQAFGIFDLVQIMTTGGPAGSTESIALYAYLNAMRFLDFGYSATIMIGGFVILSLIIYILYIMLLKLNIIKGIRA